MGMEKNKKINDMDESKDFEAVVLTKKGTSFIGV